MRDIVEDLLAWQRAGIRFALATVVRTWNSSPRPAGAAMAVSEHGEVVGSVSGGCVEGAVHELAREVLDTGKPVVQTYGVQDDDAFAVGLTCGGVLDVLVTRTDETFGSQLERVVRAIQDRSPVAVATVVEGDAPGLRLIIGDDGTHGSLGDEPLEHLITEGARGMLQRGSTGILRPEAEGQSRTDDVVVFVESYLPPPRMIVFGAVDFAAALSQVGKSLGHHVTVCDARAVFATPKRFPEADEVVVDWPHRYLASVDIDARTMLCVLTHDPKFDIPLLKLALRTPAGYVGAMGSRRTHEDRLRRLREEGVTEVELSRLSSPIGLDLGAGTPEETAVSIAAEVIAMARGGTGRRLSETTAPIHRVNRT